MEEFKTCELIEELKKREAVQSIWIEPYKEFKVISDKEEQVLNVNKGPAQILVVWD